MIQAGLSAHQTLIALIAIELPSGFLGEGDGLLGTDLDTRAAPSTLNIPDHEAWGKILRFRVGTPKATQRTPLHKNGGSDARPVVDAESLDIENQSLVLVIHVGRLRLLR
jgi:hypothetical protein